MVPRARRVLRMLVAPVLLLPLLVGPVAQAAPRTGADAAARAVAEPGPVAVLPRYLAQEVSWSPCSFDARVKERLPTAPTTQCAVVKVPMDWRHPDAHRDIDLAIAFSRATGASKGLLTSNPGGPGEAGRSLTAALALSKQRMFAEYDLLGFDPRGFGDSENIHCLTTQSRLDNLPSVVDYRHRTPRTHLVEVAEAKLVAEACSATELSRYISTQQTVYDLDFVRALLGYRTLNYIGYSYGTWLGAWYADTYPARVGRFLLDSNMRWTASRYANQAADSYSFQRRRDKMLFPWIARHRSSFHLGDTSSEVRSRYEEIRATLARRVARGEGVSDPQLLDWVTAVSIYLNEDFVTAAVLIALLGMEADDPGSLDLADRRKLDAVVKRTLPGAPWRVRRAADSLQSAEQPRPAQSAQDPEEVVELADLGGQAVNCNDTPYSTDINGYLRRADADARAFPFLGYVNTVPPCAFWPFRQSVRTPDLRGAPRMLMLQSEGDPATAYEGAQAAHLRTASTTRMVAVDNDGQHGQYVDGPSSCLDRHADRFLFSGVLPGRDIVCKRGLRPLPGDSRVYRLNGPLDGSSYPLSEDTPSATRRVAGSNPLLSRIRQRAANRSLR